MKEHYQLAREIRNAQLNSLDPKIRKEERKKLNEQLWEKFDKQKADNCTKPQKRNTRLTPKRKPSTPEEVIADRERRITENEIYKKRISLEMKQQRANKKLL